MVDLTFNFFHTSCITFEANCGPLSLVRKSRTSPDVVHKKRGSLFGCDVLGAGGDYGSFTEPIHYDK